MTGPGPLFLTLLITLVLFVITITVEKRRDKRLFLTTLRNHLDRGVEAVTNFLARKIKYITNHVIQLSWYYSLHKVLRGLMTALVKSYDYLEAAFQKNRARAKILRREKKLAAREIGGTDEVGYLGQVAEHKEVVKLSESQKEKLLQKNLEGK